MHYQLLRLASTASFIAAPIAAAQAVYLRRVVPRLPEASGARSGVIEGKGEPLHLLTFGESTAAGVGAETQEEALGYQTALALAERLDCAIEWRVVGKNGVTAKRCSEELVPLLEGVSADLISIALGANDVFQLNSPTGWQRDLLALLFAIRSKVADVPIFVSGMPPIGRFPALTMPLRGVLGLKAQLHNEATKRALAPLPNVWHVDAPFPLDPSFFGADQFHPGPKAYKLWGELLADKYEALVQNSLASTS